MADKKISELTELTTPDGTEELVVNDSGVSKKIQIDNLPTPDISSKVNKSGDTMTGDLNLGDNVKAQFGAGNDLQIYHDGYNSIIKETAAGSLKVYANEFYVFDEGGVEPKIGAKTNGSVDLYYDAAKKLATTSTGIDVTGRITTDGITEDSSGNVGIGTTSPASSLHAYHATSNRVAIFESGDTHTEIDIKDSSGFSRLTHSAGSLYLDADVTSSTSSSKIVLRVDNSEKMRIDSSGNVLVGKTTANSLTQGIEMNAPNGYLRVTRTNSEPLLLHRASSDGDIVLFRKDNTTVGSIGVRVSTDPYFVTPEGSGTGIRLDGSVNRINPCSTNGSDRDNVVDLGHSGARFDDIYATNGTIQTSDRNEKQDIEELTTAEQNVAIACKGLLRKFRWQDAVAEKGDEARIHFGIIAQDLQDAFTAEGLDAGRYAMFISSTWYEKQTPVDAVEAVEAVEATYDDEGNELTPAVEAVEAKDAYVRTDTEEEPTEGYTERTRLGVRYPELLAFIIAAL